jgi:hypothetical protein
VLDH